MISGIHETKTQRPYLVIMMGVSGCGKSTIAKKLASLNNLRFLEGDDYHSQNAKDKMKKGIALGESDRKPWIQSMCRHLESFAKSKISCCLAYSGLKASHRKQFAALRFQVTFIHLFATREILESHLEKRANHFFDVCLLDSQLEALEKPTEQETIYKVGIESSIDDTMMKAQQILLGEFSLKQQLINGE